MQDIMTTVTSAVLIGVQEATDGDVGNLRGGVVLLLIFGWIGAFAVQMYRTRRRQRRVLESQAAESQEPETQKAVRHDG